MTALKCISHVVANEKAIVFQSAASRYGLMASVFLTLLLGGCASVSPDIGDMTSAYAESVEKHERNQILKNLLRASDGISMSFTTVPTIVGTGQLDGTATMSGTLLSDSIKKATDSLSLRSSRGFNFTLASLDNERFVTAFLRNISLDTVHVFSSSGDFHRQLLFTLVADSISLNPGGANQKVVQNGTATRERFEQFQSALADLVASGLSTERFIRSDSIGIELTREELLTDRRFFGTELANDRNIQVLKVSTPAGERYRVVRFTPSVRFCLSPQEYAQRSGLKLAPSLDCRPSHLRTGVSALAADAQANDSLAIELRSAREVYRFVGRLAMAQVRQTDWVPSIHLPERQAGIVAGSHPLIVLRKGSPAPGEKVLAIAEHMGATYYVPFENSGFSARVFECLSLLLSSSMVKDAIPTQPAILIR